MESTVTAGTSRETAFAVSKSTAMEIRMKDKRYQVMKKLKEEEEEEASRKKDLENVLQNAALEVLVHWRDNASCRVSSGDILKKKLIKELAAVEKQTQSDIKWIRKLNNTLNARTFGRQKHTKGERVRVSISKEVVRV